MSALTDALFRKADVGMMQTVGREHTPYAMVSVPGMTVPGATLGPLSVISEDASPEEIEHEKRHAAQFAVPGWSLLKLIDAFYPYEHKPMERDAYRHVQSSHELLRKYEPGLVGNLVEKYIRSQIGK